MGERKDEAAAEAKKSDDEKAMDAKIKAAVDAALKGTVSAEQMKAAIKLAADGARKEGASDAVKLQRSIGEARDAVRPWVGDLAGAYDSAPDVHRAALKAIGVDGVDGLHADALLPVLKAQPKPGDAPASKKPVAQDGTAAASFDTMFGATKLKRA